MPTEQTLLYHGKPMNPEPRHVTLDVLAEVLRSGHVCAVSLEPGDGSRYDLLLVPIWTRHLGILAMQFSPEAVRDTMYVIDAKDHDSLVGATIERGGYYGDLRTLARGNEWTLSLLEWWFERHVWPRIRPAPERPKDFVERLGDRDM